MTKNQEPRTIIDDKNEEPHTIIDDKNEEPNIIPSLMTISKNNSKQPKTSSDYLQEPYTST